jgi:hypothetical protein
MRALIILLFDLFLFATLFGQDKISGKVVSENNEVLVGASVFIPNTAIGTTTNSAGEFVLNNIPKGSFKLAISFVGYDVLTTNIPATERSSNYMFKLKHKIEELESVVISKYDKGGWPKWGQTFTAAFIGTSAYAENCNIINKEVIRFLYVKESNELHAYADKPLIIENRSLGYRITVELVSFTYDLLTSRVDYQMYSFFEPMQGTEEHMIAWKNNRKEAYAYSLMHFMRSLFSEELKSEGFEVRMIERKTNTEKLRVQGMYKKEFEIVKDSLNKQELREKSLHRLVERRFSKDSLKYYRKVLEQDDRTQKIHDKPLPFKQFARKSDSTVQLNFENYLLVTYNRKKEPVEYFAFRNVNTEDHILPAIGATADTKEFPYTVLYLTQGIPIEVNENGYFNNIDLILDGFWGWWERLGTKLPYDYNP